MPGPARDFAPDLIETAAEVKFSELVRLSGEADEADTWAEASEWERSLYRNSMRHALCTAFHQRKVPTAT